MVYFRVDFFEDLLLGLIISVYDYDVNTKLVSYMVYVVDVAL